MSYCFRKRVETIEKNCKSAMHESPQGRGLRGQSGDADRNSARTAVCWEVALRLEKADLLKCLSEGGRRETCSGEGEEGDERRVTYIAMYKHNYRG